MYKQVTPKRTDFNDTQRLSDFHRNVCGYGNNMTDIDMLVALEYGSHSEPKAIIDYKCFGSKKPKNQSSLEAQKLLANSAKLPFFVVSYDNSFNNFTIYAWNDLAKKLIGCDAVQCGYLRFVKFHYFLRHGRNCDNYKPEQVMFDYERFRDANT